MEGKQAIRKNNWKAIKLHVNVEKPVEIELYNLHADPGETTNVADRYPKVLDEIMPLFDEAHGDLAG